MSLKAGYICQLCGADRIDVPVRERAADEGIENYLYHVGRMASEHHRATSPACPTDKLDIKLPMTGNGIGVAGDPLTPEEMEQVRKQLGSDKQ